MSQFSQERHTFSAGSRGSWCQEIWLCASLRRAPMDASAISADGLKRGGIPGTRHASTFDFAPSDAKTAASRILVYIRNETC
mgnify:CR=1 FL=1